MTSILPSSSSSLNMHFCSDSPYCLSSKDYYNANMAANIAEESEMTSRHGCVATYGNGKILASATNCIRSVSKEGFFGDQCSCHAEVHTLRKLYYSHVNSSFQNQRKRYCLLQWQKDEGFL